MKVGAVIGSIVVVAVGLAVIILLRTPDPSSPGSKVGVGVNKAEAAKCDKPGYECLPEVDFVDVNGKVYTKGMHVGKVVMVNFWATWCKPCKIEVPHLSKAYDKYKDDGFVLYGVMTDNPNLDVLERFAKDHNLTYPVIQADYPIMEAWQYPPNLPTTFIYDRSGALRVEKKGILRESDLERMLPELLAEPAPATAAAN